MKYLFRDRVAAGRMLSAFFKESGDTHPDHHDYHPHFELYFRREPMTQEITMNGESLSISSPAVVLTAPFQIHAMSPAEHGCPRYERHVVYFNERLIEAVDPLLPRSFFAKNANCLFPLTAAEAELLSRDLDSLFDESLPERERAMALALLLMRLDRTVEPERRRQFGRVDAYIPRVLQYLYDHASEALTTEEIAARFHVSRAKLDRDFRASVGGTLHGAVMDLRLSRAMSLLRETDRSVAEIAAACGFSSEYYFHAFFKRMAGKTPMAFRKGPA
ncbi:MAG: helix-turn-helix transcriptional regulator [Clostridia bacterium]|nr:helix-turn-helix transcriptional regulator [Clostridia bacterium]